MTTPPAAAPRGRRPKLTDAPLTEPVQVPLASVDDAELERWALAYLRHAPLSLCLRELNRLLALALVDGDLGTPPGPVLDVGCGDGFWWTQRDAGGRPIYGVDISAREVGLAQRHIEAAVTDISAGVPFSPTRFAQIIGNCSLEHVREIDRALRNLRSAAADDARLILFVPTPQWAFQGAIQRTLLARMPRVAMTVSGALNGFFQHWHLYELPVWTQLLAAAGWKVTWSAGLGSRRSEFLYRAFLPPAFLGFLAKQAAGEYPSRLLRHVPDAVLRPLAKLVTWAVRDPLVPATSRWAYEYVIVATPTGSR